MYDRSSVVVKRLSQQRTLTQLENVYNEIWLETLVPVKYMYEYIHGYIELITYMPTAALLFNSFRNDYI